jgi:hypothetical protein
MIKSHYLLLYALLSVPGINTENEDNEASTSSSSLVSLSCTPQYWTENATKYLLIYTENNLLLLAKEKEQRRKCIKKFQHLYRNKVITLPGSKYRVDFKH